MTAVRKQVGTLMLLMSCAAAQSPTVGMATVQDVVVSRAGANLQVEIILSSPVHASLITAEHPDRLVLQLPDTTYTAKPRTIDVNWKGVRSVRTALHSANPPTTHVVVDLDQAHPYALTADGQRLILTVSPVRSSRANISQGAPTAGASAGLAGIFHRGKNSQLPADSTQSDSTAPSASGTAIPNTASPANYARASSSATAVAPPEPQVATVPQSRSTTFSPQGSAGQLPSAPAQVSQASVSAVTPAKDAASGTNAGVASAPVSSSTAADEPVLAVRSADPSLRTVFRVKYVAEGVAYLDGGRSSGLTEGMKLEVQDTDLPPQQGAAADPSGPRVVAELEVTAVAETSAVTDIHTPKRSVKPGDLAYLSSGDSETLVQERALSATRKYPAVITFTEGDPLDEEVRAELPRPPLPSVNRARGRIGVDYMGTSTHGAAGTTSSDIGMVMRTDITRIGGTYWNLSGFWRGRLTSQSPAGQQTLQDLINRTYHLSMTYDNPNSTWVAGVGRLYLPWANSLDTIDGGYFGKRLSKVTTLGIFGGSTPDPTSWDYSPDRVIGGSFINFEGGNFDAMHYSSTLGAGVSMLKWQLDKPFGFVENVVSYKRFLSVYNSLQVDSPSGNPAVPAPGAGLSRNFFTLRVQPHPRLELDFNYNYFRDVPTFDPQLIGTGLLDKYLFQGFSVGGRVEVHKQIFVYTDLGRSNRSGDAKSSLNQMYGITFGHLPWLSLRADAHYSKFDSSFGSGSYKAFSISRNFSDNLRLEVLAGTQSFASSFTTNNRSRFVTANVETNLGPRYFFQGGFTTDRGQLSYDQWMFTIGYRFDSKERRHE